MLQLLLRWRRALQFDHCIVVIVRNSVPRLRLSAGELFNTTRMLKWLRRACLAAVSASAVVRIPLPQDMES